MAAIRIENVTCDWGSLPNSQSVASHISKLLTIKQPPAHPVTIIPIAIDTLADPNTWPITVGVHAKNPPFAMPLMTTKKVRGTTVLEAGHRVNVLTALKLSARKKVFKGPKRSLRKPQPSRPEAEARLRPATRPAPTEGDRPNEVLYRGRKKGGTKIGNVAAAPARKRIVKRKSRKSRLHGC